MGSGPEYNSNDFELKEIKNMPIGLEVSTNVKQFESILHIYMQTTRILFLGKVYRGYFLHGNYSGTM